MNLELATALGSALLALLGLGFAYHCFKKQRQLGWLLGFAEKQIADLEDALARDKETATAHSQRLNEQSRRITWLEQRIRQTKAATDEVIDDVPTLETPKMSITERRHLVISLAARGQNIDEIALALGILPGEVDLIINLNHAIIANRTI